MKPPPGVLACVEVESVITMEIEGGTVIGPIARTIEPLIGTTTAITEGRTDTITGTGVITSPTPMGIPRMGTITPIDRSQSRLIGGG